MTATLQPAGPFGQCASACFLFAGLFGDVLLIRLFLTLAYIFLLLGAATGYPRWSGFEAGEAVSVDSLVWASLCLLLHGYALVCLLMDERRIRFAGEDEEQLWRFFYRRSGMGRLEFKQVLKRGRWVRVRAGQRILTEEGSQAAVCLLVEGQAAMHTAYHGVEDPGQLIYSGVIFDLGLLNVFGVYIGFESKHKAFYAVAHTDCLLYSWTVQELNAMATQLAPVVASFWRNFTLSQLGMEFDWRAHDGAEPLCATGEPEGPGFLKGGRSRDFTDPLRPYEQKRPSARAFLRWLWRWLSPLLPAGVRHNALPVNGILARNRVVAVKAAEAWVALSRQSSTLAAREGPPQGSSAAGGAPASAPLVPLQPAVSKPGTAGAHHMVNLLLRKIQSLQQIEAADVEELVTALTGATAPPPHCPVPGCGVAAAWGEENAGGVAGSNGGEAGPGGGQGAAVGAMMRPLG